MTDPGFQGSVEEADTLHTSNGCMIDPGFVNTFKEIGSNAMESDMMESNIKTEFDQGGATTASVPIPGFGSHRGGQGVYDQFSPSPLNPSPWVVPGGNLGSPLRIDPNPLDSQMDFDEEIFQVDESNLVQDTSLAGLNTGDGPFMSGFNLDDLLIDMDMEPLKCIFEPAHDDTQHSLSRNHHGPMYSAGSFPLSKPHNQWLNQPPTHPGHSRLSEVFHPENHFMTGSAASGPTTNYPHLAGGSSHSTLQELLMRSNEVNLNSFALSHVNATIPSSSTATMSSLSQSAPAERRRPLNHTHGFPYDTVRVQSPREPRRHLHSVGAESNSSLSTGSVLSPDPYYTRSLVSQDEDSDGDTEHDEYFSNDNDESECEEQGSARGESAREKRPKKALNFWQYNVQSKGPKGQRLVEQTCSKSPYVLNEAADPVFSPQCALQGIKHSGKARKGDGNDFTPDPRKLHDIGLKIEEVNTVIHGMSPLGKVPESMKTSTRQEKNKLASRVCRFKKKANHEANKIQLSGLEREHRNLVVGITEAKETLVRKIYEDNPEIQKELTKRMASSIANATRHSIGSNTTEYVNAVLNGLSLGQDFNYM